MLVKTQEETLNRQLDSWYWNSEEKPKSSNIFRNHQQKDGARNHESYEVPLISS